MPIRNTYNDCVQTKIITRHKISELKDSHNTKAYVQTNGLDESQKTFELPLGWNKTGWLINWSSG
jgi:hypothetical protein